MLAGVVPLGLAGLQLYQSAKAQEPAGITATAQADANRKAEEEAARLAAEIEAKRKVEEEAARQQAEAERLATEIEAKRKAEEEAARQRAEAERLAAEIEAKRKAEEEAARKQAEAERLAAEIEAKRKADEEAQIKAEAEAEAKRQAEDAARRAEAARLSADAEAKRAVAEELLRQTKTAAVEPAPEPAPASASPVPSAACVKELEMITARRKIFFRSSSADLRHNHAKILDAVAALAKRCTDLGLVVSGHTDATGNPETNQQLSEDRAEAVRAALVERGVDSKQLEVRAFAERQPSDGVMRPYARAAERRAEFTAVPRQSAAQPVQ
jgi:outer membrane protein OmpA-like peptidoglycan-associated protein